MQQFGNYVLPIYVTTFDTFECTWTFQRVYLASTFCYSNYNFPDVHAWYSCMIAKHVFIFWASCFDTLRKHGYLYIIFFYWNQGSAFSGLNDLQLPMKLDRTVSSTHSYTYIWLTNIQFWSLLWVLILWIFYNLTFNEFLSHHVYTTKFPS